jgi:hypothetical protein
MIDAHAATSPSLSADRYATTCHVVKPALYPPCMATCPGALIVHADDTVMGCTEDDERDGCRGRDLRNEGGPVRCWTLTLTGCNYCGVQ